MNYENNDFYEGNWENDKKSGKGLMIFASGKKYEGDFVNEKFNGKGKL